MIYYWEEQMKRLGRVQMAGCGMNALHNVLMEGETNFSGLAIAASRQTKLPLVPTTRSFVLI